MKQLYRVEITTFVMAENSDDAINVTVANIDPSCVEEFEVGLARTCPQEWYDAIPYGSDDDKTVGQLLALQRQSR